jgi:hypothetical protein
LLAATRRRTLFDPGEKPEAISFATRRTQASSDPPQFIRIKLGILHLLPNRLDAVDACRTQQAARR